MVGLQDSMWWQAATEESLHYTLSHFLSSVIFCIVRFTQHHFFLSLTFTLICISCFVSLQFLYSYVQFFSVILSFRFFLPSTFPRFKFQYPSVFASPSRSTAARQSVLLNFRVFCLFFYFTPTFLFFYYVYVIRSIVFFSSTLIFSSLFHFPSLSVSHFPPSLRSPFSSFRFLVFFLSLSFFYSLPFLYVTVIRSIGFFASTLSFFHFRRFSYHFFPVSPIFIFFFTFPISFFFPSHFPRLSACLVRQPVSLSRSAPARRAPLITPNDLSPRIVSIYIFFPYTRFYHSRAD